MALKPRQIAQQIRKAQDKAAKEEWERLTKPKPELERFKSLVWEHVQDSYRR